MQFFVRREDSGVNIGGWFII